MNTFVALVGLEVWSTKDLILVTAPAGATLDAFNNWRNTELLKIKKNDNAQLIRSAHKHTKTHTHTYTHSINAHCIRWSAHTLKQPVAISLRLQALKLIKLSNTVVLTFHSIEMRYNTSFLKTSLFRISCLLQVN